MKYKPYPAYKDSGVKWLGEVPEHWLVLPIWMLFELGRGRVISHDEIHNNPGSYPVYSSQTENDGVMGTIGSYDFQGDYITWTTDGANAGTVFRRTGQFNCTNVCGTLKAKKELSLDFCRHALSVSTSFFVRQDINPKLMNNVMAGIRIPCPSFVEQIAIASQIALETAKIDTLIARQEKLIELLQEKRQALISHVVTKGLNPDAPMKDSGVAWLGEVPKHWEIWQSRRLFSERKERIRPGDEQLTASQKYGVIPQKLFTELEDQKVMQVLTNSEILKHVEPGDFVISMRSFQGGIEACGYRGCVSSAYVPLIPGDEIAIGYFRYLFKSATYIQALQSTSNLVRDGQALRFANFVQVHLPRFPKSEQEDIARFLDAEISKIDALEEKSRRSIELMREHRTALISAAVTGKIDVRTQHQAAA